MKDNDLVFCPAVKHDETIGASSHFGASNSLFSDEYLKDFFHFVPNEKLGADDVKTLL